MPPPSSPRCHRTSPSAWPPHLLASPSPPPTSSPRKFILTFFDSSWVGLVGSPVSFALAWAAVLAMKRFHFSCAFNFNQQCMTVKDFFSNFLYTTQARVGCKVKHCRQCISVY